MAGTAWSRCWDPLRGRQRDRVVRPPPHFLQTADPCPDFSSLPSCQSNLVAYSKGCESELPGKGNNPGFTRARDWGRRWARRRPSPCCMWRNLPIGEATVAVSADWDKFPSCGPLEWRNGARLGGRTRAHAVEESRGSAPAASQRELPFQWLCRPD